MLRLYPKSLFMRFSENYSKMNIGQASSPSPPIDRGEKMAD